MNYFFIIIYYVNLIICSSNLSKPKLCIDCKFSKKSFFGSEYNKCSLFEINYNNDNFLVDGIERIKNPEYYYCSIARGNNNMCGKDGKLYEKRIKNNFSNFLFGLCNNN